MKKRNEIPLPDGRKILVLQDENGDLTVFFQHPDGRMEQTTKHESAKALFRSDYPEIVYTEMDNGIFWRSLERYEKGDIIEHEGRRYEVLYSWVQFEWDGIPVYMAELNPQGASRSDPGPSRLGGGA